MGRFLESTIITPFKETVNGNHLSQAKFTRIGPFNCKLFFLGSIRIPASKLAHRDTKEKSFDSFLNAKERLAK